MLLIKCASQKGLQKQKLPKVAKSSYYRARKGRWIKKLSCILFSSKIDTYCIKLLQSIPALIISVDKQYINPLLFIIWLSYPRSVQTSYRLKSYANYTWISLQQPSCFLWWH
jgi:hypothetical protein